MNFVFFLYLQGFEELEPFIPIEVVNYSDDEIHSCYDYYVDRLWIQNEMGKGNFHG